MRVALLGFDPGIRDTGAVALTLDFNERTVQITTQVWSGVTRSEKLESLVDEKFLDEAAALEQNTRAAASATFVGIEGYRQRGMDVTQDRLMLNLIMAMRTAIPKAKIIDNTGIKKVVTESMLKLFQVSRFRQATNHQELKSAARVALKLGIEMEPTNNLLSDFVRDNLMEGGERWEFKSMLTL